MTYLSGGREDRGETRKGWRKNEKRGGSFREGRLTMSIYGQGNSKYLGHTSGEVPGQQLEKEVSGYPSHARVIVKAK